MSGAVYEVTSVEPVIVLGPPRLTREPLMSPYVWVGEHGALSMLVRSAPAERWITGSIWYAKGDGLTFQADGEPVLMPGPEEVDIRGCEDPTLVHVDDGCLVYYTGVRSDCSAQLLYATGPDIHSLSKRGVAHAATASDRNTKEAAVERVSDRWLLLFEYSRNGHSRVGHAEADGPAGPWQERCDPFRARPDAWDNWHVSTGPLLLDEPGGPVMFYNGGTKYWDWAIGWIRFDERCGREIARCRAPLIPPPREGDPRGRRIAFAASAVRAGNAIWLYFSINDRSLFRATLHPRWCDAGPPG